MSLRAHWPAAVLALVAAAIAVVAHLHLFPAMSWNRDEPVYLWNVEVLRQGQLTATDGGHPELFLPWLSAARDGEMFTQYTLGWPLALLAARVTTGTAAAALPVGAALAVIGTYAMAFELSQRRRLATVAGALLVASPILAIQGGVYLSYLFTLGIGLSAGALLLSGHRRDRPARHLAAGVLLGWVFLTRPYDALLWGGAFAVGLLLTQWPRRTAVLASLVRAGLAATPFVVVALLYNRHVTGELLTFPITAADPLDGFGFGERRLMPGFDTVDYGLGRAVRSSFKNGALLPWFLAGGYLGAIVALMGLWYRRRDAMAPLLLCVALVFPLGYFVFWGTYLSSLAARISGPIYLVPLYAVLCILAAAAIDRWWTARPAVAAGVVVVLAIATLPGAITRFAVNREISLQQEPWRASAEELDGPSLVVVADTDRYLVFTNPFSSNPPELDGDVLYATSGNPSVLDLLAAHPDRAPYFQQGSVASQDLGPREDPRDLVVTLTPIEVVSGPAVALDIALAPPPGTDSIELVVDTGADVHRQDLPGGPGEVTVTLGAADGALAVAARGEVTVTAHYRSDGTSRPVVRRSTPYRVVDDQLEVFTPFDAERYIHLADDFYQWWHEFAADDLTVAARPA